jgi:hypothetical protein
LPYTLQIRIVKGSASTALVEKHVEKLESLYKKSYNVTAFSFLPKKTAESGIPTKIFIFTQLRHPTREITTAPLFAEKLHSGTTCFYQLFQALQGIFCFPAALAAFIRGKFIYNIREALLCLRFIGFDIEKPNRIELIA